MNDLWEPAVFSSDSAVSYSWSSAFPTKHYSCQEPLSHPPTLLLVGAVISSFGSSSRTGGVKISLLGQNSAEFPRVYQMYARIAYILSCLLFHLYYSQWLTGFLFIRSMLHLNWQHWFRFEWILKCRNLLKSQPVLPKLCRLWKELEGLEGKWRHLLAF